MSSAAYSTNQWASVSKWAGIECSMSPGGRAAIALAIAVGAGLATVLLAI